MKKLIACLILSILAFHVKSQSYIIGYEYWCDTAYSSRVMASTPPVEQLDLDTMIAFPGLAKGLHSFHIRFQQINFYWSQPVSGYFFKTGDGTTTTGIITAYRYWVDNMDTVVTIQLSTPVDQTDLVATLDLTWVNRGSNYLHMQFGDEQGNWSVASIDSFYKASLPIPSFTSRDTLICGGDSVHFQNLSNDADVFLWRFGDGDSSTAVNPVHYYGVPGNYTVTLTATDTIALLDSTIIDTSFVSVHPPAQPSFTYTQVGVHVTFTNTSVNALNYKWEFGDSTISYLHSPVHSYPHDGVYTVILTAWDSCGSVTDTQTVTIITTKIDEFKSNGILVVQSSEQLFIHFSGSMNRTSLSLVSSNGQMILQKELPAIHNGYTESISTQDLSHGIYFLKISGTSTDLNRKIFIY